MSQLTVLLAACAAVLTGYLNPIRVDNKETFGEVVRLYVIGGIVGGLAMTTFVIVGGFDESSSVLAFVILYGGGSVIRHFYDNPNLKRS